MGMRPDLGVRRVLMAACRWVYTGDIGCFSADDELFIVDRIKVSITPPFALVVPSHRACTRKC